ncbi:MAG: dTDP-4-keto-6-deoxy-D-glucose epimerase [Methanomicrobiales archaeon]|nr:dTDP-4-keto-6-deoxy-D-glucose epimerase [Methanomicrobiales archaeon]
MRFVATPVPGAYLIEIEPVWDERGYFARSFCRDEFGALGLPGTIMQCNISRNAKRGTLRGMHYQAAPYAEAKYVSCIRGSIYDVIIDLRPDSPAFCDHFACELRAEDHSHLFIPEGCAHGFQALEDGSEVFYQMMACYHPGAARGVRWDDPAFAIPWPIPDPVMSPRDAGYPDFAGVQARQTVPEGADDRNR